MNKIYSLAVLGLLVTQVLYKPSSAFCQGEPEYNGRAVSEWLARLQPTNTGTEKSQANEAIRQLGSNALPSLMRDLRDLVQNYATNPGVFEFNGTNRDPERRALVLVEAFRDLGDNAKPAATELASLFNQGSLPYYVGPMLLNADKELGETTFAHALTNQSDKVRETALASLVPNPGGTNALVELAGLAYCLNDDTPDKDRGLGVSRGVILRIKAANALGIFDSLNDPERRVQVLLERFKTEKDRLVRQAILSSLGRFGPKAKSALPYVRQATNDPDHYVALEATKSIKAIEANSH